MKKIILILIISILYLPALAQQNEFEGLVIYGVQTKSKSEVISDKVLRSMTALGNNMTILIKKGNYKQISGICTTYFITKNQKIYYKFNSLDTLYYIDYSYDTAVIKKITKSDEKRNIAGFTCNKITIEAGDDVRKYYYSPSLYLNPEYDRNNTLERYDIYTRETSSIYLEYSMENKIMSILSTAKEVQQIAIADSVFELPKLPYKKFQIEQLITPPEFARSGGFAKYLDASLDKEVASKYLKIPKGEQTNSQTVIVKFMINEFGRVVYSGVENNKDVHPKLAEEALRVINASPIWKPAMIYGSEKTIFWQKVPIIFQVTKSKD